MINKVIFGLLNADANYKSAIGVDNAGNVKLYPSKAPQGVRRPYATYSFVSKTIDHNKDEAGMKTFMVQIDQFGSTENEAEAADTACAKALDHFKGVVAGVTVSGIREMGGGGGYDNDTETRRRMSEFSVKIQPY